MVNYNNGKIYKIVCNTTGLVYIGSTTKNKLCERLTQHKSRFKKYNEGDNIKYSSFLVLENNNYNIILIENYKCNSKDELKA
jgi:predicted GIY-YIG superfamily endonuclease